MFAKGLSVAYKSNGCAYDLAHKHIVDNMSTLLQKGEKTTIDDLSNLAVKYDRLAQQNLLKRLHRLSQHLGELAKKAGKANLYIEAGLAINRPLKN